MNLGTTLEHDRVKLGLNRRSVSKKIGVSYHTIFMHETTDRKIRNTILQAYGHLYHNNSDHYTEQALKEGRMSKLVYKSVGNDKRTGNHALDKDIQHTTEAKARINSHIALSNTIAFNCFTLHASGRTNEIADHVTSLEDYVTDLLTLIEEGNTATAKEYLRTVQDMCFKIRAKCGVRHSN